MFTPATANQSPGLCPAHRFPGPPLTRRDPSGLMAGAALRPRGFPGGSRTKPLRLPEGGTAGTTRKRSRGERKEPTAARLSAGCLNGKSCKYSNSVSRALVFLCSSRRPGEYSAVDHHPILLRKVFENYLILFFFKRIFQLLPVGKRQRIRQEDHEFESSLDYTLKYTYFKCLQKCR